MAKDSDDKKRRDKKLPKPAEEMTSKELMETVFSKEVRKELDKLARPDDGDDTNNDDSSS